MKSNQSQTAFAHSFCPARLTWAAHPVTCKSVPPLSSSTPVACSFSSSSFTPLSRNSFLNPFLSHHNKPAASSPRSPNPSNATAADVAMSATREFKVVVVGAGNAAGYLARHLSEYAGSEDGRVSGLCLIGEEDVLPYERPALSKAVLFNEKVRLPGFNTSVGGGGERQTDEWYAARDITVLLSSKVMSVDTASKTVTLASGDTVRATDALVLATGASPIRLDKMPGGSLAGVYYLRNNDDAMQLYDALQAAKSAGSEQPVVVVGGGYIGLEVSAAAKNVGVQSVTAVFPEPHVMPRLFTPDLAAPYEELYEARGVTFRKGVLAQAFNGDAQGRVASISVKDLESGQVQDIPAGMVIVGVGARPETALVAGQVAMDERGGIEVNAQLETSVPGVYAIGDIANFPLALYGGDRKTRMEHVQNCRDMAAHLADVLTTNAKNPYYYLPYFYSRVFNASWQFFGENPPESTCTVVGTAPPNKQLKDWRSEEEDGPHPQILAAWTEPGSNTVKGIFMESPSPADTANMKTVATAQPTIDVAALAQCKTVQEGWDVILAVEE